MSIHRSWVTRAGPMADDGVGSNLKYELSARTICVLAGLMGISLWNACEMILVTYMKYRHLRTLYFWSILSSATGVIICTISQIINVWVFGKSNFVSATLGSLGWIPMVTGQSLVLYSRLHMLYIDRRILRFVLAMIIIDAITLHITGIVLIMGSNSNDPGPFLLPYSILEKLQVTAFFLQEAILSSLYLWSARKFLRRHARSLEDYRDSNVRVVKSRLRALIIMSFSVIVLDVAILVLEYLGLYIFQLSGKDFVYSVKLKIELGVLNQLRDFVKRTRTLDSSLRARDEAEHRQHIERQWESALRRAFGSLTRSLGRARSTDLDTGMGMRETPGHGITRENLSNCISHAAHTPTTRAPSEFFNVEVICTSTIQGCSSPEEGDLERQDCIGRYSSDWLKEIKMADPQ